MVAAKKRKDLYGKTHSRVRANVATVEGVERGVYFRVFFKRMDKAEDVARKTGGELQDLTTLKRRKWVAGAWRDA